MRTEIYRSSYVRNRGRGATIVPAPSEPPVVIVPPAPTPEPEPPAEVVLPPVSAKKHVITLGAGVKELRLQIAKNGVLKAVEIRYR